ncbi:MAG: hypothetical protein QOH57_3131 [Mycobacterium sp.]|nr:hypothetical protein [Mycobacterium sp.]
MTVPRTACTEVSGPVDVFEDLTATRPPSKADSLAARVSCVLILGGRIGSQIERWSANRGIVAEFPEWRWTLRR